jgi:hypothetical protein
LRLALVQDQGASGVDGEPESCEERPTPNGELRVRESLVEAGCTCPWVEPGDEAAEVLEDGMIDVGASRQIEDDMCRPDGIEKGRVIDGDTFDLKVEERPLD